MVSTATAKDGETGDLVLRIRGTCRHGQIVRLQSEKCTIGSGPQCTLRLRARGVRPLHCLIVRGAMAAVVRRWHPDTRLNGEAFTESILSPGDRLSIGPVEFEVLQAIAADAPKGEASLSSSPTDGNAEAEQSKAAAELKTRLEELAAREAQLESQRQGLEAERREWEAKLANTEQTLEADPIALESQRQEIEEERRQWEAEQSKAAAELKTRLEELAAREAQLESQRQGLEAERREWEAKLADARRELRSQQATLESEREELEEQRRRWEVERDAAIHRPVADEPDDSQQQSAGQDQKAPVSSLDILRRMGAMPQFPEDEPDEQRRSTAAARSGVENAGRQSPRHSSHEGEDEESIDDYMSRLLQRMRGMTEDQGPASKPSQGSSKADSPVNESTSADSSTEPASFRPSLGKRREPVEMSPRAVAPEKHINLTAMREIANLSAQSAIDRHSRRLLRRVVYTKLAVAILGLVAGCALLGIWWYDPGRMTFSAAMASFVVAMFWGIQYFALVVDGIARRATPPEAQDDEPDSPRKDSTAMVEALVAGPVEASVPEEIAASEADAKPAGEDQDS